ncbi:MAG: hypothetical protein ACR2NA_13160 [Solirubrobacterales bacterium]
MRGIAISVLGLCAAVVLAACGSSPPQDNDNVGGEFPVRVTTSEFPTRQRLARDEELTLAVKNTGDRAINALSITIEVEQDGKALDSFSIRDDQRALADPTKPVWILEDGYPRVGGDNEVEGAGADSAKTNTFIFGELQAGEEIEAVWRVVPVRAGTYVVNYEIAPDPEGTGRAVDESGEIARGSFQPTISGEVGRTSVDDQGNIVEDNRGSQEDR